MSQQFQDVLDKIENSKHYARIQMENSSDRVEREYWIGMVGGLQVAKQHIEKEMLE